MKAYRIDTDAKTIEERSASKTEKYLCFAIDVDGAEIYRCNHPSGRIHECTLELTPEAIATQEDMDQAYCSAHGLDELAEDCQFGGGGMASERAEDYRTRQELLSLGFRAVRYEDGVECEITETIMIIVPMTVTAVEVD